VALRAGDGDAALSALEGAGAGGAHERMEAMGLEALAHQARGDRDSALARIEDVLALAERTGHRSSLTLEDAGLEPLLVARIRAGTAHRAIAGEAVQILRDDQPAPAVGLDEALTRREREVLSYLPTMLANREIAEKLDVSTNTVKTHLRCLYRKLDADGRRDAVARALELHLIRAA
jgi:LuxR family maltose regulon positive regulatory protein